MKHAGPAAPAREGNFWRRLDKGQLIKWTVYTLLICNWAYYGLEEWEMASHTLRHGGGWYDWTEAFSTTIDEFGWIGLILLMELETYALSRETVEKRAVAWTLHLARLACYAMLAHTVVARVTSLQGILDVQPVAGAQQVCDLADQNVSWGYNYAYEVITLENCERFTGRGTLYQLEPTVVTDRAGWELEKINAWIDLNDAVVWLLVVWAIELVVFLQNRDITGGRLMLLSHAARAFYAVLFAHAAWWAWNGHWVWAWDQFVWIFGWWAIERNLSKWREEIREEHPPEKSAAIA